MLKTRSVGLANRQIHCQKVGLLTRHLTGLGNRFKTRSVGLANRQIRCHRGEHFSKFTVVASCSTTHQYIHPRCATNGRIYAAQYNDAGCIHVLWSLFSKNCPTSNIQYSYYADLALMFLLCAVSFLLSWSPAPIRYTRNYCNNSVVHTSRKFLNQPHISQK